MNRVIKFRAWHRKHKEWHYFDLIDLIAGRATQDKMQYENWARFTGLTDKNGKEIYEGDIVWLDNASVAEPRTIQWSEHLGGWAMCRGGVPLVSFASEYAYSCEVIGNIYENKELLDERSR